MDMASKCSVKNTITVLWLDLLRECLSASFGCSQAMIIPQCWRELTGELRIRHWSNKARLAVPYAVPCGSIFFCDAFKFSTMVPWKKNMKNLRLQARHQRLLPFGPFPTLDDEHCEAGQVAGGQVAGGGPVSGYPLKMFPGNSAGVILDFHQVCAYGWLEEGANCDFPAFPIPQCPGNSSSKRKLRGTMTAMALTASATSAPSASLRVYWESTESLLRVYWESTESLLRVYWESTESLLSVLKASNELNSATGPKSEPSSWTKWTKA